MIKHIFFDLDKTLWDFTSNSRATLSELYDYYDLGSVIPTQLAFISHYEYHNEWCWEQYRKNNMRKDFLRHQRFFLTLRDFGLLHRSLAKKLGEAYVDKSPTQTKLVEGSLDTLEQLHPHFPLSIITNGFEEIQSIKLKSSGIDHYFTHIITSERAGCRKPHAGIFKLAMKLSKCKAQECLMVGDAPDIDIAGARQMNWQAVWFNPNRETAELSPKAFQVQSLMELPELIHQISQS